MKKRIFLFLILIAPLLSACSGMVFTAQTDQPPEYIYQIGEPIYIYTDGSIEPTACLTIKNVIVLKEGNLKVTKAITQLASQDETGTNVRNETYEDHTVEAIVQINYHVEYFEDPFPSFTISSREMTFTDHTGEKAYELENYSHISTTEEYEPVYTGYNQVICALPQKGEYMQIALALETIPDTVTAHIRAYYGVGENELDPRINDTYFHLLNALIFVTVALLVIFLFLRYYYTRDRRALNYVQKCDQESPAPEPTEDNQQEVLP